MRSSLAALLLAASWASMSDERRRVEVAALHEQPLAQRLVSLSERFLGTPYVLSPLGEGTGRDADPMLRFDAVDCLTMVEETMALALAPTVEQLRPTLDRIRYSGEPAWETRNHVMEAQWLPGNLARGFLRDVTRAVGVSTTRHVAKLLTRQTWEEKSGRALALPQEVAPVGEFGLDVIPADQALTRLANAPSGTVVVVVRADRPWLVTRVSHVGVLVQTAKGPVLRHASRSVGKVTDELLSSYLRRNLDSATWMVEGLALYEVTEPPAK